MCWKSKIWLEKKKVLSPLQFLKTILTIGREGRARGCWMPSISSSPGALLVLWELLSKDIRTRWSNVDTFYPFCHFFPWDREDRSWHAEDAGWSGAESSQRAGSLCPQFATAQWEYMISHCGHSGPFSLGTSGTQGIHIRICASRHALRFMVPSKPTSDHWEGRLGLCVREHGKQAIHQEKG